MEASVACLGLTSLKVLSGATAICRKTHLASQTAISLDTSPPHLTLITAANTPRYLVTLRRGRIGLIEAVAAHLSSPNLTCTPPQISTCIYAEASLGRGDKEKKEGGPPPLPGLGGLGEHDFKTMAGEHWE